MSKIVSFSFIFCCLMSYITSEPLPGGGQWGTHQQGGGRGSYIPYGAELNQENGGNFGRRNAGLGQTFGGRQQGSGNDFGQNSVGRRGAGNGFGGQDQSYPSNSYNNPQSYGYDYKIPGADVHFAASRGPGGTINDRSASWNGNNGGNGWPQKNFRAQGKQAQDSWRGNQWPQNSGGRQGFGGVNQWPRKNSAGTW